MKCSVCTAYLETAHELLAQDIPQNHANVASYQSRHVTVSGQISEGLTSNTGQVRNNPAMGADCQLGSMACASTPAALLNPAH